MLFLPEEMKQGTLVKEPNLLQFKANSTQRLSQTRARDQTAQKHHHHARQEGSGAGQQTGQGLVSTQEWEVQWAEEPHAAEGTGMHGLFPRR